ncbi:hypothetical protein K437DRAFT_259776, partial [Tilletiaria anomala UBC 951]
MTRWCTAAVRSLLLLAFAHDSWARPEGDGAVTPMGIPQSQGHALSAAKDKIIFLARAWAEHVPDKKDVAHTLIPMVLPWLCLQVVLRTWLHHRNGNQASYAYDYGTAGGALSTFSVLVRKYHLHGVKAALRALPSWMHGGAPVGSRWSHLAYELAQPTGCEDSPTGHSPAVTPPPPPKFDEESSAGGADSDDEEDEGQDDSSPEAVTAVQLSWWSLRLETTHFNLSLARFVDYCANESRSGTTGASRLALMRAYTGQTIVASLVYSLLVLLILHIWAGTLFWRFVMLSAQDGNSQTNAILSNSIFARRNSNDGDVDAPYNGTELQPEPPHLSLLIPGISLPVSHLPLLIGSLIFAQFIHEILGHTLTAAVASQRILGAATAYLPRRAGIWMPIPGFVAGAYVVFPRAIKKMDIARAVDQLRRSGGQSANGNTTAACTTSAEHIEMQSEPPGTDQDAPRLDVIMKAVQLQSVHAITVAAGIGANVLWLLAFFFTVGLMPDSSFSPDAGAQLGLVAHRSFLRANTYPWNLAGIARAAGWSDDPLSAASAEGLQGGLRISNIASTSPLLAPAMGDAVRINDIILALDDVAFYKTPSNFTWGESVWNGINGTDADQRLRQWEMGIATPAADGQIKGWCYDKAQWKRLPTDGCDIAQGDSDAARSGICFQLSGNNAGKELHRVDITSLLEGRVGGYNASRCERAIECPVTPSSDALCIRPNPREQLIRLTLLDRSVEALTRASGGAGFPSTTLLFQAPRAELLTRLTVSPYTPRALLRALLPTFLTDSFLALAELALEYFVLVSLSLIVINSLPLPGLDGNELLELFATFLLLFSARFSAHRERDDGWQGEDVEGGVSPSASTSSAQMHTRRIQCIRRVLQIFLLAELSVIVIDGLSHWLNVRHV